MKSPADRIASAPKAWVAIYGNQIMAWGQDTEEGERAIRGVCKQSPFDAVRVALVEIPEDEK